ncbi:hypothetical protein PSN45_001537 [Yamadazyma tenuis]|uniref:Uncharacterized protein n=1 Tax=Candida tenuis (strain ATCC 10573 / BCRC 21748 / CBS 615 / JCM 9827 / NBRC 10315 / NRRL Y-1498 / VKM Y-70) TaxID=590646 RepID=G3BFG8_CANTC|nr:uncharacterized protein CANTEDRAFT_116747 [Yamadazyma tenuis ATCC 10573]EGV60689.1 hypothetical protein CANTEDRAFT_116747 [Yamadazyma tenuis ATCC 10573]WEJ94059.1 hypothetical protein PSN45_001537 [Yamadazyma tenuis]
MSIPKLTIPETAFDPSIYTSSHRRSRLLVYLLQLTNSSAILLVLIYVVSYIGIKPLLELTCSRRLEMLDKYRHKLRDLYLLLVSKVDHIPIVGFNRHGKVFSDAMIQTDASYARRLKQLSPADQLEELEKTDKLNHSKLLSKLRKLNDVLSGCTSYTISEMPHYKSTRETVKSFQHEIDTKIFDYDELYTVETNSEHRKKRNLVVDTKNDIRSIKGLFMSGQA